MKINYISMELNQIIDIFQKHPYYERMGKGKLAKQFNCTTELIGEAKKKVYKKELIINAPKILLFDIETVPLKAYVWSRWNQNIYLEQTISEWYCLSWSAKWLDEPEIISDVLTSDEVLVEDDRRIMLSLWKVLDSADIVIGHNCDKFDIPKVNSRFLIHGFPPTRPYQQIDTQKIVKQQFGFSSNKLDALAGYFNIEHKLETSFKLWKSCVEGNTEALKYMEKYNRKDVLVLEEVYLHIRSWIKNHPNVNLYKTMDSFKCPTCGGEHLVKEGYYYTANNKYKLYRCDCGALSRQRTSILTKEERFNILNNNLR